MVDDLWNDNRRLEKLLKTEVGATSVALGMVSPACVCIEVCVSLWHGFGILCRDSELQQQPLSFMSCMPRRFVHLTAV